MPKHQPPKNLSAEAARLWSKLVAAYGIKDARGQHLLTLAFVQYDRAQEAGRAIAEHGALTLDRYNNLRASPAVAIESRAARVHAALLGQALKNRKPVDAAADRSRGASVVALHKYLGAGG